MFHLFEYRCLAKRFQGADSADCAAMLGELHHDVLPSNALKLLSLAIDDGNPHVRHSAAVELARFEHFKATQLLAAVTHDEDPWVAKTAAQALLERAWQPQKAVEKRRLDIARLEKLCGEGTAEQRKEAALLLARMDDPCALFTCAAAVPPEVVRELAVEAAPQSMRFLMHAVRNHPAAAAVAVKGLVRMLAKHGARLSEAKLQDLAAWDDVATGEPHRTRRPVNGHEVRRLAKAELTRRVAEKEKHEKYFCPECSRPLNVAQESRTTRFLPRLPARPRVRAGKLLLTNPPAGKRSGGRPARIASARHYRTSA